MKSIKKYLRDNLGIILALVAMILFLYVYPKTHNTFLTTNNIFNVLRQSATNLMLACGMTMVIILGGKTCPWVPSSLCPACWARLRWYGTACRKLWAS